MAQIEAHKGEALQRVEKLVEGSGTWAQLRAGKAREAHAACSAAIEPWRAVGIAAHRWELLCRAGSLPQWACAVSEEECKRLRR
eukprot:9869089-Alexandrium_andersonii.AAC.1